MNLKAKLKRAAAIGTAMMATLVGAKAQPFEPEISPELVLEEMAKDRESEPVREEAATVFEDTRRKDSASEELLEEMAKHRESILAESKTHKKTSMKQVKELNEILEKGTAKKQSQKRSHLDKLMERDNR